MNQSGRDLERRAQDAELKIPRNGNISRTIAATVESADLYMQALRLTDVSTDRRRLKEKCKELLNEAERLKSPQDKETLKQGFRRDNSHLASNRQLTTREQIILLEGSKLNGSVFRTWTKPPSEEDFAPTSDGVLFSDSCLLSLSHTQQESFAGWKRPRDAFSQIRITNHGQMLSNEPCMSRDGTVDLVQDMTSDCSVVASLCAVTSRAERGHHRILGSVFWPYDDKIETFVLSPNGKYVLRFHFNGCWRQIEIDDRLPTSTSSRLLHVIDRSHPGLLWPALVEKAYLKVRGGYDFPGSNSGTDLAVLTGWIPQQIFLHRQDIDREELWSEVASAFQEGRALLTIGTGKIARREQKHLGLAPEHDYAVLEMKVNEGVKEMLIKNPWADGDVWTGAARKRSNPSHETPGDSPTENFADTMMPGTFWMDFDKIFQYFENLYINWDPMMFSCRQDRHFTLEPPSGLDSQEIFVDNPQFLVKSSANDQLWLLLNRHFRTGDHTQAHSGKNGYISLYLYDRQGQKVLCSDGAVVRGPFVDSPNTLLRFEISPNEVYTAVVVTQSLPPGKHNFTLSLLSQHQCTLGEAEIQYKPRHTISAAWTRSSAGGNSDSPNYLSNPQFKIVIQNEQKAAFVLRILDREALSTKQTKTHAKILLLRNDGSRVSRLRLGDIVTHSGDYRRGTAVIETSLPSGIYILICSTFEENQYVTFELDFYSNSSEAPRISQLPSETSGRISIFSSPAIFSNTTNRLLAPLTLNCITKGIFIARQKYVTSSSCLFKLRLEQGQGPYKIILASSGSDNVEYQPMSAGLRIENQDLHPVLHGPLTGGLWLVLERLPQSSNESKPDEVVEVEILVEDRVELGPWGIGDG